MSRRRRQRPGIAQVTTGRPSNDAPLADPIIHQVRPDPSTNSHNTWTHSPIPGDSQISLIGEGVTVGMEELQMDHADPHPPVPRIGKPRRPRTKARVLVRFDSQCPYCREVIRHNAHFDREHNALFAFLLDHLKVARGEQTYDQMRDKYVGGLKVATKCPKCDKEYVINRVTF